MGRGAGPAGPRGTGTAAKPVRTDQASRFRAGERPLISVYVSREIVTRLSGHQGYRKALKEFADAVERGEHPKRVYKPSGVDKKGERFEPYIRLGLWHHHLGRIGDPLLILQVMGNDVFGFALTTHAAHFDGDKVLWLQEHIAAIDWLDCEDLREEVEAYLPECKQR